MSSQIEVERKLCYRELEAAQPGDVDIARRLAWLLGCLGGAIEGAANALSAVLTKARFWQHARRRPINDRQRSVLHRLLNGFEGFLTTSKCTRLARCSADTALRDIRVKLKRGILVRNPAGGRGTSYRLADPETLPE